MLKLRPTLLHVKRYAASTIPASTYTVVDVLSDGKVGERVTVKGWIRSLRSQKRHTFVDLGDGSTGDRLQVVLHSDGAPYDPRATTGASVRASGVLDASPAGRLELRADELEVYGGCDLAEGYPFAPRKSYAAEYVRRYPHLRPRTKGFSAVLRVRSAANLAVHNYFESEGFCHVHAPVVTSNDCEGAGEVFRCLPDNRELLESMSKSDVPVEDGFFDKRAYLTVSGQLHLEATAHGISKVYCLGPTFRAENSRTRFHLSEFYMLEAEIAFLDNLEELTAAVEKLLKAITRSLLDSCEDDIETCRGDDPTDFRWLDKKFTTMSYEEAVNTLRGLGRTVNVADGLSKEDEISLVRHNDDIPIFVVEWPRRMKPFYMRECQGDRDKVAAFDLLVPNVGEVAGGSLRENVYEKLRDKLPKDDLDWYLELRRFGGVPTGGYGLGFERYLMMLLGIRSIKDVIPFPRWPHNCSL